jgi:hypothetical protein
LRPFKSQIANLKFLLAFAPAFACLAATTPQPPDRLPENRFLLIVDTSSQMEKRAAGLASTVDQLLRSGFQGQARPGDTIAIWTYNETLTAGEFPLQTWSKDAGKRVSSGMLAFLSEQKLHKPARFKCVQPALQSVVNDSPFITVVILCSGLDPIKGTPFDKDIARQIAQWRDEEQKAGMPLIVLLRAAHGAFTHYSVTPAPWQIEMPPLPSELVAVPPAPKPAPIATPNPAPVAPLIVVGKHTPPLTRPDAAPTKSIVTNSPAIASMPPAHDSSNSTNLAAIAPPVETVPLHSGSDLIVHAREAAPLATAPLPASRPNLFSAILKRSLIAAAILAALSLLLLVSRRPRQNHVSLITHSINRDR